MGLHGIRVGEARRLADLAPDDAPEIGADEIAAALVRGVARRHFLKVSWPLSALALGSSASTALASNGTRRFGGLGVDLRDRQRPARPSPACALCSRCRSRSCRRDHQHRREHCPGDLVDLETIHVNCDVPEA